jgi:divalent metal cation (Fe/Co/Zn/Cd) transporter
MAILVAFNILWMGFRLMQRSFAGLMEQADETYTSLMLQTLEQAREERIISNYHQLRHRQVHDQVWVEYHLLFPRDLSITEAHDRSHRVEDRIASLFPKDEVFVTAHLEPDHHEIAHPGGHAEPSDPLGNVSVSNPSSS